MQDKEYTTEELDAIVETLPGDVKDAIFSVNSAKIINEVGKKYGLHIDQIGIAAEETGNILLGISRPTEFVDNLQTRLRIERVRASEVAAEINEKIFSKIRESLRNLHGAEKAGREISDEEISRSYIPKKEDLLEAIQKPDMYTRPKNPEPAPPNSGRTSILDQKLSGVVSIPKVERERTGDPYRETF
ncbi:MAG: hypothetical protein HZA94_02745 [Candidatus Vogelbacteria bacterium]|nr:hypothetical protein [Candidatus Vogelbacteria bacterium]